MPRVNLLPVRALAKLERAQSELLLATGATCALLVLLIAVAQMGAQQTAQLAVLQAQASRQLDQLAGEVVQTEKVKASSVALQAKLDAIDKLRVQKVGPAQMLGFFSDVLGELPRVWLLRLSQQDDRITLEGGAMSQGDISAFQLALGERRPAFRDVELALVSSSHSDATPYMQWTITCRAPADTQATP